MFVHSSVEKHLGCFYFLTVVNNSTMNMSVQMSVWDSILSSFPYISRNEIAELYDISIFNFLRNYYISHSNCTILHCYWQGKGSSFSTSSPTLTIFFLSFFDSSWVWLLLWRDIFSNHCLSFSQVVLLVSLGILLCILNINLSSDIWFAKVFSHSIDCLFHSVDPLSISC